MAISSISIPKNHLAQAHGEQASPGLYQGVRSGKLNQNEFIDLATRLNHNVEASTAADSRPKTGQVFTDAAVDQQETIATQNRMAEYQKLLTEYQQGDQNPQQQLRDGVDGRQHEQLIQLYNGIRNGDIDAKEAVGSLRDSRGVSQARGQAEADGSLSQQDQTNLNGRLNQSGQNLAQRSSN